MGSSKHYREGRSFSKDDLPKHTKYSRSVRMLGILEIILGLLLFSIGLAIMVLVVLHCMDCDYFDKLGAGIWGGVLLMASGIIGTTKKPNSSAYMLNANLLFSIVAGIAMPALFVLSLLSSKTDTVNSSEAIASVKYLHLTLCAFSACGLVAAVTHSAFCCAATCRPRPVVAVIYENPRTGEQQVLYEDTKEGSFLPAPPPQQQTRSLPRPQAGRSFLTPTPYDSSHYDDREDQVFAEEGKRKRRKRAKTQVTKSQNVNMTTERKYLGVVSQIAHKQKRERTNYDNIPPNQRIDDGIYPARQPQQQQQQQLPQQQQQAQQQYYYRSISQETSSHDQPPQSRKPWIDPKLKAGNYEPNPYKPPAKSHQRSSPLHGQSFISYL